MSWRNTWLNVAGRVSLGFCALWLSVAAEAGVYVVSSLEDSGPGTLREALEAANAFPGTDVIEVDVMIAGGEILLSAPLVITDAVTVVGPLVLSGQSMGRVLEVDDGLPANKLSVSLTDVRLHSGAVLGDVARGGIIYNAESLRLERVTVEEGEARGAGAPTGDVVEGGCIYSAAESELRIDSSTMTGCRLWMLSDVAHEARGGAIYAAGTLDVVNSTVAANSILSFTGDFSNVADATALGAAIYVAPGATWSIAHATLAHNGVIASAASDVRSGLHVESGASGMLTHAIVTDNIFHSSIEDYLGGVGSRTDLFLGEDSSVQYSIVTSLSGSLSDGVTGNRVVSPGATLVQSVPSDNGGTTRTLLPVPGGPADGAGDPARVSGAGATPAHDQRGSEYPRVVGVIDIGALERAVSGTIPVAVNDAATTLVRESVHVDVMLNDSIPEGAGATPVAISDAPSYGSAQALSNGQIAYTPVYSALVNYVAAHGELPTDEVGYRLTDAIGQVSGQAVLIVSFTNQPPTVIAPLAAAYSAEKGTLFELNLAGHMGDPDGAAMSYVLSGAAGTGLAVEGNLVRGVLGTVGTYTITVNGTDGIDTTTSSFQLEIIPSTRPNQPPQPTGSMPVIESVVGAELDLNLQPYFVDPDGDTLTYSLLEDPSGSLTLSGGRLGGTFTSTCNCIVRIGVSDGTDSITADIPLSIAPSGNVAPQIRNNLGFVRLPLGYAVSLDLDDYFYDPNGDALSYTLTGFASSGLMFDGVSTVSGALSSPGVYSVMAVASDGYASTSMQVWFEVTGATNNAPVVVAAIDSRSVPVGTGIDIDLSQYFLDPDGDNLVYSVEGLSGTGLSYALGRITGVLSARGIFRIVVSAGDGLATVGQTFTLQVDNRFPQASTSSIATTVRQGQAYALDIAPFFSDADGDTLTYTLLAPVPVNFAVDEAGQVTASTSFPGEWTVVLRASDGLGGSASITLHLTVAANTPPSFLGLMPTSWVFDQGDSVSLDFRTYATDPDGDSLFVTVTGLTASGLDSTQGVVSGTATVAGRFLLTVRAADAYGGQVEQVVELTVVGDTPPVLIGGVPDLTVDPGDVITVALLNYFWDASGSLSYTIDGLLASQYQLIGNTLTITLGTPGLYPVTIVAADAYSSVSDSFGITVTDPAANPLPVLLSSLPTLQATPGMVRTVDLAAYFRDPEGQLLLYSLGSPPAGLTASASGSVLAVTGIGTGEYSLLVRATDPAGGYVDGTVVLVVREQGPVLESGGVAGFSWLGVTLVLFFRSRGRRLCSDRR